MTTPGARPGARSGARSDARSDPAGRGVPRWGGLNPTLARIEVARVLRNRRTLVIVLVLPAALFLSFSGGARWQERVGHGNVAAYVMTSMAFYGAALTAASAGTSVALERAQGWSRQLRLTPLHPAAYVVVKAAAALVLSAVAIAVVNVVALAQGRAEVPAGRWVACALLTLVCTLVFAALGVFVGFLVPGENAMQVLGPGLAVLAFLGDVFVPIDPGSLLHRVAEVSPMYGVVRISRWPLTGELGVADVANALVWLALFVAGAAWRMSRDGGRV